MKLRHLFTINFFLAIFFGLTCSILPSFVLQMYGLSDNEAAIWTTRLLGGTLLGFATLLWFGRKTTSRDARRAIALALLTADMVGLAASLEIQLGENINAFGWSNLFLYGILVIGYSYFLFIRPEDS